ncbi:hypothetical protein [Macrococcoides bohemicum]|uniref:hypothetical protein n=1 Tax=Macrococcoides bohemicum TaxID=1903056 RepID=UPI00193FBE74|nr:hypothetical protein [Macrococcus bohemicus]QRN49806.1 hypothetical protein HT586_06300 [Macrococcus bohemicus]QYA43706.1 hypothetical protein KYI13_06330 [Macrococcus bohemicus]
MSNYHIKILVLFIYAFILFICRYGLMIIDDKLTILLLVLGFGAVAILNKRK